MKILSLIIVSFSCLLVSLPLHADVAAFVSSLNQHAGNVRALGPQTMPGPGPSVISSAIRVVQNPAIISEIQRMEGQLLQSVRVLSDTNASPRSRNFAAERMARVGPRLIQLMEARAGLVTALNQTLRSSVAQANGVRPYVSLRGSWLPRTLQIIREARSQLSQSTNRSGATMTQRLARGIDSAFQANRHSIRSFFTTPSGGGRGVPTETPNIIVDPSGEATIER